MSARGCVSVAVPACRSSASFFGAPQAAGLTATPTVGASAAAHSDRTAVSGVCDPELSPSGSHRVAVGPQRVTHRAGLLVQRSLRLPLEKGNGRGAKTDELAQTGEDVVGPHGRRAVP